MNFLIYILLFVPFAPDALTDRYDNYTWSEWNKYKDCPGIAYRSMCSGPLFEGSMMARWKVEIYNQYETSVETEIMIVTDEGKLASEVRKVRILPEDTKKIIFLNVRLNCETPHTLKFDNWVLQ